MTKTILFAVALLLASLTTFSATFTITNNGSTFSPATLTIAPGDSVNFVLTSFHNAVEVNQTNWNANNGAALVGGFQVPFGGGLLLPAQLISGTHYYVCTNHIAGGMKATIIVQKPTGVLENTL